MKDMQNKKKKVMCGLVAITLIIVIASIAVYHNSPKQTAQKQLSLADECQETKRYEDAIVIYEKVLQIDNKSEVAYIGIAKAYIGLESYNTALETLNHGIDLVGETDTLLALRKEVSSKIDLEKLNTQNTRVKENKPLFIPKTVSEYRILEIPLLVSEETVKKSLNKYGITTNKDYNKTDSTDYDYAIYTDIIHIPGILPETEKGVLHFWFKDGRLIEVKVSVMTEDDDKRSMVARTDAIYEEVKSTFGEGKPISYHAGKQDEQYGMEYYWSADKHGGEVRLMGKEDKITFMGETSVMPHDFRELSLKLYLPMDSKINDDETIIPDGKYMTDANYSANLSDDMSSFTLGESAVYSVDMAGDIIEQIDNNGFTLPVSQDCKCVFAEEEVWEAPIGEQKEYIEYCLLEGTDRPLYFTVENGEIKEFIFES